eukprot:4826085-Prorocentrum_lima.AAC.1
MNALIETPSKQKRWKPASTHEAQGQAKVHNNTKDNKNETNKHIPQPGTTPPSMLVEKTNPNYMTTETASYTHLRAHETRRHL